MHFRNVAASLWEARLLRFSIVGGVGFLVDTGLLYALIRTTGMDPYSARLVSFLSSATTTWALNRSFTFAKGIQGAPTYGEWAAYLALMMGGGVVNYGVYSLCITFSSGMYAHPVLAVAAGSVAGLFLNFSTSRNLFLRPRGRRSGKRPASSLDAGTAPPETR